LFRQFLMVEITTNRKYHLNTLRDCPGLESVQFGLGPILSQERGTQYNDPVARLGESLVYFDCHPRRVIRRRLNPSKHELILHDRLHLHVEDIRGLSSPSSVRKRSRFVGRSSALWRTVSSTIPYLHHIDTGFMTEGFPSFSSHGSASPRKNPPT
jgi:hypothetical protein